MPINAYPLAWAQHDAVRATAARWQKQALITPAQQEAIKTAYPVDYYQPNIFLRVGLFFFACLGAAAAATSVGMFWGMNSPLAVELVCGIGAVVVLELAIRNGRHYHSGLDTAALYVALLCGLTLLYELFIDNYYYNSSENVIFGSNARNTLLLLAGLALLAAAALRYADRLVAAGAFCAYLALVANLLLYLPFGILLLPFALMLAAGTAYWLSGKARQRPDYEYYAPALRVVRLLALVTFYLAGNYLVVREGHAALTDAQGTTGLHLGWLFWGFTVAVPLAYICLGLRRANQQLLLVGLGVVCFSIYTFRHYHSVLPPEIAGIVAGLLLIGISAWALHYLRTARHGLTAVAEADEPHFNLESLLVAETAPTPGPPEAGFAFGGGASGGGGATGRF